MTEIIMDGYFTKGDCEKIKEKMTGKTYLDFEISYSNHAGNCSLIIGTGEDVEKEDLRGMFVSSALVTLAKL